MRSEVIELYLDDIIPNRFQPREKFDEEALRELSTSIKEHGVIQPIIVRQIGEKYEIIAGERRYKASALAGLTKIPAIIRNLDDKEASKVALLENLQRRDLSAIEEARTYQKILDLDSMTQEELGRTMGKSQAAIANKLRLLSLTDEVQEALLNDQISERHARSLLGLTNANAQVEMLNRVIRERMTVRELDGEIKRINADNMMPSNVETPVIETPIIQEPITSNEVTAQPVIIEEPLEDIEEKSINNTPSIEPSTNNLEQNNIKNYINDILSGKDVSVGMNDQINNQTFANPVNLNTTQPETNYIEPEFSQAFAVNNPTKNSFIPTFDLPENMEPLPDKLDLGNQVVQDNNLGINNQFKYKEAVDIIKNVIPDITSKGINTDIQEFDLDNKYQIIINIDKN